MTNIYETTLKMHNTTQSAACQNHAYAVADKPQETLIAKVLESVAVQTLEHNTDSKENLNCRRSDAEENFPPKQQTMHLHLKAAEGTRGFKVSPGNQSFSTNMYSSTKDFNSPQGFYLTNPMSTFNTAAFTIKPFNQLQDKIAADPSFKGDGKFRTPSNDEANLKLGRKQSCSFKWTRGNTHLQATDPADDLYEGRKKLFASQKTSPENQEPPQDSAAFVSVSIRQPHFKNTDTDEISSDSSK